MNTPMSDPRASFSTIAAVLITAIGLTLNWIYPDVPDEIMTAWGAVFMLLARFAEVWYDRNSVSVPKGSIPGDGQ